jgi:hypothetical protein
MCLKAGVLVWRTPGVRRCGCRACVTAVVVHCDRLVGASCCDPLGPSVALGADTGLASAVTYEVHR